MFPGNGSRTREGLRKIARYHSRGWYDLKTGIPLADAISFVVEEPECPSFSAIDLRNQHRTADGKSELILMIGRRARREIGPRIEVVISQEFIDRTVQLVGAGLDHYVDVRPGDSSVLCAGVGLDFEFLDGVDGRMDSRGLEESTVVLQAVERIVGVAVPQ